MFFIWITITLLVEHAGGRPQMILFDNFVGFNKQSSDSRNKTTTDTSGPILFPGDIQGPVGIIPRINEVPNCANGLSFCENVASYPYNYLKNMLEKNKMLKVLFGQDEVPEEEISKRLGEEDETFICKSVSKTIFPKMGQNKNKNWKYIINQGEQDGFVQGVQIEVCKNPDGGCDFPGSLPLGSGYHTFCKQKYVYRRLLSLNSGGKPVPDTFKIPSACCCAYKQNFDFLSRFGKGFTPTNY